MILLTWRSDIKLNCLYEKVSLRDATKVLLKDKFHQIFEEEVGNVVRSSDDSNDYEDMEINKFFVNKKIKYVWDANHQVILCNHFKKDLKINTFFLILDLLSVDKY